MKILSEQDASKILLQQAVTDIYYKGTRCATFCDTAAGIGAIFRTYGRTDGGRTDGRESRNSYLDVLSHT